MAFLPTDAGPHGPEPEVAVFAEPGRGGRSAAPAVSESGRIARLFAAYKASVWMPVATRVAAISIGMLGLAGIGAASILSGVDGVSIPTSLPLVADVHSAWLALPHNASAGAPESRSTTRPVPSAATPTDATPTDTAPPDAAPARPEPGMTPDGKVILNTANSDELTHLPGIGRKRAEAIVQLRTRLKKFKKPQDLLRVRGIGPKSLKRMLPHLVVDPPTSPPPPPSGGSPAPPPSGGSPAPPGASPPARSPAPPATKSSAVLEPVA